MRFQTLVITCLAFLVAGSAAAHAASPTAQSTPSGGSQSPSSDGKVVFTVGSTLDLVSPNPFKAESSLDYEMVSINYDLLFNFNQKDLAPESGLGIYPPQVSEDHKTWTIKIRKGVMWNDGVPFTAHDVAFTYNFIKDNHLAVFSDYLGDAESFTAPDDTTLVWKMKTPTLSPLTPPYIPILPEHIWAPLDGKPAATIKEFKNIPVVGTGPFKLVEWKEGQFVRFERNPYYWGTKPQVDEAIYKNFENAEALTLALENGEVDFAEGLTPLLFNRLKSIPNITTNVANVTTFDDLAFNFEGTANPALRDEQVRKAISLGINRQALVDRVLFGDGSVGNSVVVPTYSTWYSPPAAGDVQGYDPEQAKQILDDAGYKDTDGDGVREGPDGPLKIELLSVSDYPYSTPSAKLIAGWLDQIGFDATVRPVSEAKVYDLWAKQDFDAYVWSWAGDPDPDFILSIFTSKQCLVWSDGCYKDPAYDRMWNQQHFELDQQTRVDEVAAMQKYLYEKNPLIVTFYERDLQAYRNDAFTGYVLNPEPTGALLFQFGPYTYRTLRPVGAGDDASVSSAGGSGGGVPAWLWIALAVIVLALGVLWLRRRGAGQEDKE